MDDMEMLSDFLVGNSTPTAWSKVYTYRLSADFLGVLISIREPIDDVALVGEKLLNRIELSAKSGLTKEIYLSLFKEFGQEGVSIAAILVSGDTATLYSQGHVRVQLIRAGKKQTLVEGGSKGVFVQGPVVYGDYYKLATNDFEQRFPVFEENKNPVDQVAAFQEVLPSLSDSSGLAAIFLETGPKEAPVIPVAPVVYRPTTKLPLAMPKIHLPPIIVSHLKLRTEKSRKALRLALALAVVVFLLVLLSGYLTMKKNATVKATLAPYTARYAKLVNLGNDQRFAEMQGLRELSRDLTARKKDTQDSALIRGFDQLLTQVNQKFASVSGERQVDKLHVFYDFRLVASDFVADSVAYDVPGKLAVFLDGPHGRVLSLSLEQKEALTLSVGQNLDTPLALAVDNRKAYVLGNNGVMELSLPLDVIGSVVVNRDVTWVSPKFLDTFGTNTYIFDTGARNLLKYDLQDPTASPAGWLKNKMGLDFESVTSLKIDGGVWLGTMTGKIYHFVNGSQTSFDYQGVLDPPTTPVYLYASQDGDKLYVLEPHANRLLVLGKDGTYREAVLSPDFATTTGVVVDETANKAYVLSGSLVYEVEL